MVSVQTKFPQISASAMYVLRSEDRRQLTGVRSLRPLSPRHPNRFARILEYPDVVQRFAHDALPLHPCLIHVRVEDFIYCTSHQDAERFGDDTNRHEFEGGLSVAELAGDRIFRSRFLVPDI